MVLKKMREVFSKKQRLKNYPNRKTYDFVCIRHHQCFFEQFFVMIIISELFYVVVLNYSN